MKRLSLGACELALLVLGGWEFNRWRTRLGPGRMLDEARLAGRATFAPPDEDYFHDIDGKPDLALDEIQGRNIWMVWSAGNDRLWDWLARESGGSFDLLKIVSSYDPEKDAAAVPEQRERLKRAYPFRRSNRLTYLGVLNEPCFDQAEYPEPRRYGLWLDRRQVHCAPDPFENADKYPGVPVGARGKNLSAGSAYGESSGVLGLRLFPNPDFRGEAVTRWDPVRYYTDASYYGSKDLVRPYRVGMTCAFCHAGLNPEKLPLDLEDPLWENVSSTVGSQYMRLDRVALWEGDASQFIWQLLHASRPGSVDQQSTGSERIFPNCGSHATGAAVGQGEAGRRVAEQPPDEQLRGGRPADSVL
jgi:hypothetical protein